MKLPTLSAFGQPRNSREGIIWVLADRPFLRFQQLHRAVRRLLGRRISTQGLFKLLTELIDDGQIKRFSRGLYGINPAWITQLRAFCEVMERNCYAGETDEEVRA
jgi:hypothetical protein